MNNPSVNQVGDKTRQSVKWTFPLRLLQKAFIFGNGIILARILTPEDFGLSAIAVVFDTMTWLILSLGVNSAVIHFQDNIKERFSAAFWMFITSAMVFGTILILASPYIATVYKQPVLKDIIAVSAIALMIYSFGAVHKTSLSKSIEFKKIAIIESFINILRSLLYVAFALAGFGVWSFVYPKVIVAVINVGLLWYHSGFKPEFKPYFQYWKEMFNYGKTVLFATLIEFTLTNFSYIFIGGVIGATAVGLYSFAYDKSMMAVSNIAYPASIISFPAYSRLQNEAKKLKDSFFKTIKLISLISIPYSVFVIVFGREILSFLYGSKWDGAIAIFQITLFYAMFRAITHFVSPLLQAVGKQDLVLRWNIGFSPIYMLALFAGYKFGGIIGIAIGAALAGCVGSFAYLYILSKTQQWNYLEVLDNIKPALTSGALLFLTLIPFKNTLKAVFVPDIFIIASSSIIAAGVYFVVMKFVFTEAFEGVISDIKKLVSNKTKPSKPQEASAAT